jgi:hypothetical protein
VTQNLLDHLGLVPLDEADDLHRRTALRTANRIRLVDLLNQGRPAFARLPRRRRASREPRASRGWWQSFGSLSSALNGIEGTQSELVRGHGLRQARYRGLSKVKLQNYFIGAACNGKRWIRREVWKLWQVAAIGAAEVAAATVN